MRYKISQRGITLLLAILITTSAMAVSLGIFHIIFTQLQINKAARQSYKAFYSADAAKECVMYYLKKGSTARAVGFWDAMQPCVGDSNCEINCGGVAIKIGIDPGTSIDPPFSDPPAALGSIQCNAMHSSLGLTFDPVACRRFSFNINTGGVTPLCASPVVIETYLYDDNADSSGNSGTPDLGDSEISVVTARGDDSCVNPTVTRSIEICDSADVSYCPQ
ncbi:MAG: hypothetical protein AAB482_00895 [Patescibacteria group bacterium]